MGIEDYWEWIALIADLGFGALFYKLYKDRSRSECYIQDAPNYAIGPALIEDINNKKVLPYACIEGYVSPIHKQDLLKSRFGREEGVIRHTLLTEHKSKRHSGYWTDVKRSIKDYVDKIPFCLQKHDQPEYFVKIHEPLEAHYIENELKVTYDKYEENKSGMISKGIDRLFGEVTKGFQEKEKMLTVGTYLLGIGRITIEDGNVTLEPPLKEEKYILTRMSKKELLRDMSSGTKGLKVVCWILAGTAVGLGLYIAYKKYKDWRDRREQDLLMEELRAQQNMAANDGDDIDENTCTICLANPRNVVLLNCGHICVCSECARNLPAPKRCPMCRDLIHRIIPVYRP